MTPAAAWADVPDIFDRLRSAGIVFRFVGNNWDEGVKKARVMHERGAEGEDTDTDRDRDGLDDDASLGDGEREDDGLTGADGISKRGPRGGRGVAGEAVPVSSSGHGKLGAEGGYEAADAPPVRAQLLGQQQGVHAGMGQQAVTAEDLGRGGEKN